MLTLTQKKTIQAFVNIYETSQVRGNYSKVTLLDGDKGGLTYGRSQTTIASGNLYLLIRDYIDAPGANALYTKGLSPYLNRLKARDRTLDKNMVLRGLLYAAGSLDPVMKTTQDTFFDRVYFSPALASAARLGITTPLGIAIVYDSTVHGSLARMALRTTKAIGGVAKVGEKVWLPRYCKVRRAWLVSCGGILAQTVYRQDTFIRQINAGNWELDLPVTAHDVKITAEALGVMPEPETVKYRLFLNDKDLGETWTDPKDGRNYFPVRDLFGAIWGLATTREKLRFVSITGTPTVQWDGKVVTKEALLRGNDGWIQLKAFADWQKWQLRRDVRDRQVILTRH